MDIIDRIFDLVDAKYKEQKDFAAEIDVHPTRVSEWRKRKSASYRKYLPQIADVLGTTVQWLVTGEEPAFHESTSIRASGRHNISANARDVAFAYDDAAPEIQAATRRLLGLD